jgi:hypothetical protein
MSELQDRQIALVQVSSEFTAGGVGGTASEVGGGSLSSKATLKSSIAAVKRQKKH